MLGPGMLSRSIESWTRSQAKAYSPHAPTSNSASRHSIARIVEQHMIELQMVIGGLGVVSLYFFILQRWQRGFWLLIIYLPFAGVVTLASHLWQPTLLFKDVLFVAPLYIALAAYCASHGAQLRGFPLQVVFFMGCLVVLTLFQTLNPALPNETMALIGLKVWLYYLPLSFAAYTFLESWNTLQTLCRLFVVLSFVPVVGATVQLVLVASLGYRAAMQFSYGDMAAVTTQMFAGSQFDGGLFGRIPSTFTFATQFFGFSLTMLVPSYIVWRTDSVLLWRRIGGLGFLAAAAATFMSGERAAFVFTPAAMTLICFFDRGAIGLLKGLGGGLIIAWVVLTAAFGIALQAMYGLVGTLFTSYASDIAYGGLMDAISRAPFGMGTGTNTGAARYALIDPSAFLGIENYYAKAVYELGIPGLFVVVGLFAAILIAARRIYFRLTSAHLRCTAGALAAFFVIIFFNSFKGWLIDLDPVNVYYWVFCGMLFKLPALQAEETYRYESDGKLGFYAEHTPTMRVA
jgi:hypothetical protein